MRIREATIDDVAAFDRLRQATFSWHVITLAAQRERFRNSPPEERIMRLAAEAGGEVVGFGTGSVHPHATDKGVGYVGVVVHPESRGQGIGSALLERIEQHVRSLGLHKVLASALDEPHIVAWAQRHGWSTGMSSRYSSVDPNELPPMPATPPGTTIADLSAITPEQLYQLDQQGAADVPGDVAWGGMSYELFLSQIWHSPDVRHDLSQVAIVDGRPVAYTRIEVNLESRRCWSGATVTLPGYRGRGLAKLLKSVALRKAAALGITSALTSNDYTNGPMLAVNDWLGYKVTSSQVSLLKSLHDVTDDHDGGRA